MIVGTTIGGGLLLLPDAILMDRIVLAAAFLPSIAFILSRVWRCWKYREATHTGKLPSEPTT